MKNTSRQINVAINQNINQQLEELVQEYNDKPTEVIRKLINNEYIKYLDEKNNTSIMVDA